MHPSSLPPSSPTSSLSSSSLLPPGRRADASHPQRPMRKVDRACDNCRRRKSKCDGPKVAGNVCSNCVHSRKPCTYLEASTPRGPPKAYVTGLEDRLERLEELLKQVRPDTDFTDELGPLIPRGSWKEESFPVASTSRLKSEQSPTRPSLHVVTHLPLNPHPRHPATDTDSSSDYLSSSDSEQMVEGLTAGKRRLTLRRANSYTIDEDDHDAINARFHGKSSLFTLIDATRRYKELHVSEAMESEPPRPRASQGSGVPDGNASYKRPEFWLAHPWELQWEGFQVDTDKLLVSVLEEFPPFPLTTQLINLYFYNANAQLPLLHRPTFERQFKDKLHYRNIWFSCVCLGVFAVASRWSNDPLVLPRNCARTSSGVLDWTCAGWHYYNVAIGIHRIRKSLIYPACLEEIQTFSLLAMFIRGTANHPVGWMFTSIGIRKAQDVGAHRKKVYRSQPSVDEELWKRAFWCLVAYDRYSSAILGRPCALADEDFDLEPPLEVDDEYWESDNPFHQPPDVPCRITFFNLWIRLSQIITFTVRTIYAVHNPRALLGRIAKVRTEEVIAQLTLALQDWSDSVPEYLRWSAHIEGDEFSNQSATLYTTYYLAEMLMYRAFIPPVSTPSSPAPQMPHISAAFPALALCTRSARSSARIVEVQLARGWSNIPTLIAVSQLSAAILTLGVWDLKSKEHLQEFEDVKPPLAHTITSYMDDIAVFLGALEWVESRWENATTLIRVLKGSLPKEETDTQPTRKQHSTTVHHPVHPQVTDPHPPPHAYIEEHRNADSEHWTMASHSSSVRTRPMQTTDAQHESSQAFADSVRTHSFNVDPCFEIGAVKYDVNMHHLESRSVPIAFDKQEHSTSEWDIPIISPVYHPEESSSYPRPHFDHAHLQNDT